MTMSSTNPPPMAPKVASPARRHRRERLTLVAMILVVAAGLTGLAAATGWQEALAQIRKLSIWHLAALLMLSLANYGFRGLRWHLFARRLGLTTRLAQDLRHFLGGFALSVTPGRVGELVRMRWIRRETGWSFARTAPLALVDRASDLAAMAGLLGLGVSLSARGIAGAQPVALLALIAAFVATRPNLLIALANLGYRLSGRWPRVFARMRGAARSLARFSTPTMLSLGAALGALGWFAEACAFYLLLGWMGADIGLSAATAIFIFATLAGGVSGAPGGIGGAEAAMVALLSLEGMPLDISLPATAIIRLTTLWFGIGVGLLVFPFAEKHSIKVRDALENY